MKAGRSISDIATELQHIQNSKLDLMAEPSAISMGIDLPTNIDSLIAEVEAHATQSSVHLAVGEDHKFDINPLGHEQIGRFTKIPKVYYDRMLETQRFDLLANNVNTWMGSHPTNVKSKRMVRTVDNTVRAVLSSRYRPLDNYDLMGAIFPVLDQYGFSIRSCQLTEKRLYIKAIVETLTTDITVGDTIALGVCIRNSDVGMGALSVVPLVERLVCKNGMTINELGTRKYHVGKRFDAADDEAVSKFFSDEARAADDKAFWLKVRDTVAGCADEAILEEIAQTYREAKEAPITGNGSEGIVEVVDNVSRKIQLNENETRGVMDQLITGGDISIYGLANAVTRHSQDVEDYDRASELETKGWTVINMKASNFSAN